MTTYQLPTYMTLEGSLPGGRWLSTPLRVKVEEDEGEILVSEPDFFIHASGATVPEAVAEFRRVLVEEMELLTADEAKLSQRLKAELRYLLNHIKKRLRGQGDW